MSLVIAGKTLHNRLVLGTGKYKDFATMQAKTVPCFENHFHAQRAAERLLEIIRESK